MGATPIKLDWSEAVADWLADQDLPCGLASAIGVTTKLIHAAQPDGTDCQASARWLEKTTKVRASRIRELIGKLIKGGWLEDTEKRRGHGGSPVYRLSFPQGTADTTADHGTAVVEGTADTTADTTADHEPPTTDYRLPEKKRAASNGEIEITEDEVRSIAVEEAEATPNVRSFQGLVETKLRQDRPRLEAIARERREKAAELEAIAGCDLCDVDGLRDVDDKTRARCTHKQREAS